MAKTASPLQGASREGAASGELRKRRLAGRSQIKTIFQSCVHNYTGSFFQGSSRPPPSLFDGLGQLQPPRTLRTACGAACGFHGDGACTDREGEADANGAVEPDHRIAASGSSRQSRLGQEGRGNARADNRGEKERHFRLASISRQDALFLQNKMEKSGSASLFKKRYRCTHTHLWVYIGKV